MINNYLKFNEGRSMKNRSNRGKNQKYQDNFNKYKSMNNASNVDVEFFISPRFEYLINKMSEIGNPISKEIIKAYKDKRKLNISYLDISRNIDNITYLTKEIINQENFRESESYKTNKRSTSKIYKVIRLLFGNKFTKNEITKFASVYKSVYSKGPDKSRTKEEERKPLTSSEVINKLIDDTKNNKLNWENLYASSVLNKKRCILKLTSDKNLIIDFYFLDDQKNRFISFNISKKDEELIFLKSINFARENIPNLCEELNSAILKKTNNL